MWSLNRPSPHLQNSWLAWFYADVHPRDILDYCLFHCTVLIDVKLETYLIIKVYICSGVQGFFFLLSCSLFLNSSGAYAPFDCQQGRLRSFKKNHNPSIFCLVKNVTLNWGHFSRTALVLDTFYVRYCSVLAHY